MGAKSSACDRLHFAFAVSGGSDRFSGQESAYVFGQRHTAAEGDSFGQDEHVLV